MTVLADKRLTPEEFLDLPDSVAYELVAGHLVERNVSEFSSLVGGQILAMLWVEARRTSDANVYGSDLSYRCFTNQPASLRRADVSVVRKSKLEGLGELRVMPVPADLVVEVLSPNDEPYDINRKTELYLSSGFPLVWIVDPENKIVFVHRADGSVTKLREKDQITGEFALPGFRCEVSEFFRR
jgi:Uma2 family endonuclease